MPEKMPTGSSAIAKSNANLVSAANADKTKSAMGSISVGKKVEIGSKKSSTRFNAI